MPSVSSNAPASRIECLSTDALAELWGVSRVTLFRWRRRRRRPLPAIAMGGRVLHPVALVERWLAEQTGIVTPCPKKAHKRGRGGRP